MPLDVCGEIVEPRFALSARDAPHVGDDEGGQYAETAEFQHASFYVLQWMDVCGYREFLARRFRSDAQHGAAWREITAAIGESHQEHPVDPALHQRGERPPPD